MVFGAACVVPQLNPRIGSITAAPIASKTGARGHEQRYYVYADWRLHEPIDFHYSFIVDGTHVRGQGIELWHAKDYDNDAFV